jgi:hypothetical protein
MDRKQPESNPVQEALRPTHLSMRRELNCNRGDRNSDDFVEQIPSTFVANGNKERRRFSQVSRFWFVFEPVKEFH